MPDRPAVPCLATNPANPDEVCAVPLRRWPSENHAGPHGWAREPQQVYSRAALRAGLRERMPAVAAHLEHLEAPADTGKED
jgi:hypothetical protein